MNRVILLKLILISAVSAHSLGRPMMAELILNSTINAKTKVIRNGCFKLNANQLPGWEPSVNKYKESIESFDVSSSCSVTCSDGIKVHKVISSRFDPAKTGLYAGDGSSNDKIMWRSLGQTMIVWGKMQCQKVAKESCESVDSYKLASLSSGNWTFPNKFNCSNKETILSPYNSSIKLANPSRPLDNYLSPTVLFTPEKKVLSNLIPTTVLPEELQALFIDEGTESTCKNRAKLNTCFGDCIFEKEDKSWVDTLSTNEFLGDYKVDICMDQFESLFKAQNNEADRDLLCSKLIWEISVKSQLTGTSCMAFRFDYTCPRFK